MNDAKINDSDFRKGPRTDRIAEVPDVARIDPSNLAEEEVLVRRREVDPSFEYEEETSFSFDGNRGSLALDLAKLNELEVPFRTDLLVSSLEKDRCRPNDRCIPVDLLLPTYPLSRDLDDPPTVENRLGSHDPCLYPCLDLDLPLGSPSESLVVVPETSPIEQGCFERRRARKEVLVEEEKGGSGIPAREREPSRRWRAWWELKLKLELVEAKAFLSTTRLPLPLPRQRRTC